MQAYFSCFLIFTPQTVFLIKVSKVTVNGLKPFRKKDIVENKGDVAVDYFMMD